MTKFEEEFEALTSWDWINIDLIQQILTRFGNWHSDGEFQELLSKYSGLNDNYEKEVIKNSKLESQIANLKSQLQQQALPVVPEYVAKDVKRLSLSTLADWNVAVSYISKETLEWLSTTGNINVFLGKSWTLCSLKINGFKVEKPQLFYLREKNTGYYLRKKGNNEYGITPHYSNDYDEKYMHYKFTQQEINNIDTGSYELVPVEDGE